jgi:peroxiredoxin 2/4
MTTLLVGKPAPAFTAKALVNGKIDNISLSNYRGKYVVFFFYPLDFTFVCPTELHAFQQLLTEFEQRETQVIGCSVDSPFSHLAWSHTPKDLGGIQGITYPIVSDLNKEISRSFSVLREEEGVALRGQFLIDKKGIIRHQSINDLSLGRNIHEVLRLLDALVHHERHGDVCPANWKPGQQAMAPTQEGLLQYCKTKMSTSSA